MEKIFVVLVIIAILVVFLILVHAYGAAGILIGFLCMGAIPFLWAGALWLCSKK